MLRQYYMAFLKKIGWLQLFIYICVLVFFHAFSIMQPLIISNVLSSTQTSPSYLLIMLSLLLLSFLSVPLIGFPNNYFLQKTRRYSKEVLWEDIETKPFEFILKTNVGTIQNGVAEISFAMRSIQAENLQQFVVVILSIVIYSTTIIVANQYLFLAYVFFTGIYLYISYKLSSKNNKDISQVLESGANINKYMIDYFRNSSTIYTMNSFEHENTIFSALLKKENNSYYHFQKKIDRNQFLQYLYLTVYSLLLMIIYLKITPIEEISPSILLVFIYSMIHLGGFGKNFLFFLEHIKKIKVTLSQLGYGECQLAHIPVIEKPNDIIYSVRNLSYSYGDTMVLKNISFDIFYGEHILIRGSNGKGKSTLLKILAGLFTQYSGTLYFNSKYVHPFNRIYYFSQDIELFNRSIYENIIYPQENCSIEEVQAVITFLQLDSLIKNEGDLLKKTPGDFGNHFSGGEKQKILLARAILARPEILLLDEPTAHLDTKMEKLFFKALRECFSDATIILISHRTESDISINKIVDLDMNTLVVEKGVM